MMEYKLKTDFEAFLAHKDKVSLVKSIQIARRNLLLGLLALLGTILSVVLCLKFLDFSFIGLSFYDEIKMTALSFTTYGLYLFSTVYLLPWALQTFFKKPVSIAESVKEVALRVSPEKGQFDLSFDAGKIIHEAQLKDIQDVIHFDNLYVLEVKNYRGANRDAQHFLAKRKRFGRNNLLLAFLFKRMYYYLPFTEAEIEQYPEIREALRKIEKDLHR